jgi:hypothetical protein
MVCVDEVHTTFAPMRKVTHSTPGDTARCAWAAASRILAPALPAVVIESPVAANGVGEAVRPGAARPRSERDRRQNEHDRPIGASGRRFLAWAVFDRIWRWLRLTADPAPGAQDHRIDQRPPMDGTFRG